MTAMKCIVSGVVLLTVTKALSTRQYDQSNRGKLVF